MQFDGFRESLLALLSPHIVVPALVFLIGVNAAAWMVVLDRMGITRTLAWWMLVPPLMFLLPVYVAFARWPSERVIALRARPRMAKPRIAKRPPQRFVGSRKLPPPAPVVSGYRRPVLLAADGLPRHRIPLPESATNAPWLLR